MSTAYVGEIRLLPFTFAPKGWLDCDGSLLPIAQYDVLFALLGTTYGGDGRTTFALPDLRGRVPLHQGSGNGLTPRVLGETGGSETVTLMTAQMPSHRHSLQATTDAVTQATPAPNNQLGAVADADALYASDISGLTPYQAASTALKSSGGNQPHDNLMPTLTVRFCIAIQGIFPSQN